MSAFASLLAGADAAVDTVFAERFDFRPMREVRNGPAVADPTRLPVTGFPAVYWNGADQMASGDGVARSASNPVISVLARYIPQGVHRMDQLTRSETGHVFEVTGWRPDEFGRLEIDVVQVAG